MKKELLQMKKALSILGLSVSLTMTGCSSNKTEINNLKEYNEDLEIENDKLNQKIEELEEKLKIKREAYSNDELYIAVLNDGEGNPEYRFVTRKFDDVEKKLDYQLYLMDYKFVTDKNRKFSYEIYDYIDNSRYLASYTTFPRFSGRINSCYWLPNYKLPGVSIKAIDFPLPDEYKYAGSYSLEELKEIERIINSPDFDLYENRKSKVYDVENLVVLEYNQKYFVFDNSFCLSNLESDNKTSVESMYLYNYHLSITNPRNALRGTYDISYLEILKNRAENNYDYTKTNKMIEFTSLDKNSEWVNYKVENVKVYDRVEDVLPDELKDKKELTYDDIVLLEEYLNKYKIVEGPELKRVK